MNRKEFLRTVAAGAAGTMAGSAARPAAQSTGAAGGAKLSGDELKGSTRAVVDFITGARLESFPPEVVAQAKRCLIDGFGVILAGSTVEGSAIVRRYVRTMSSKGGRVDFRARADVCRGAACRARERRVGPCDGFRRHATVDDSRSHVRAVDASNRARAGVIACGRRRATRERVGVSEAFLTGFEVECKIAEAIDPEHYRRGFHSTATAGTFAGAAAPAAA